MNIEREQKYIKKINALSDWKEYCLESKYPNFHTVNLIYMPPLRNYERCTITVASVTITNSIRTLPVYCMILFFNGLSGNRPVNPSIIPL